MHRSMQRVMGCFTKKWQRSPYSSASAHPCAAATADGAYKLQEKDPGWLHRMASCSDLALLRRWRLWLKRVGINRRDKTKWALLHLACANGQADVVRFLVQENSQLNVADNFQCSPLMKAVQCQQEECVAVLLQHGADPNLPDAYGNTALHLAVLFPSTAIAGLLLEYNANIGAQNQEGYTPLNLAVSKHREEMVKFLLKRTADRKLLGENVRSGNTEESSAGGAAGKAVPSSSCPGRTADLTWAALAQDRGGALPAGGTEQEEDAESPKNFKGWITQLQKLANALKKQSMSEASLEVVTRYHSDLKEDKLRLQKELDSVKAELWEVEEQHLQSEQSIQDLQTALDNKEREVLASSQKLQDLLLASAGTNTTIKQLEEHVQHLEIENARLEATVQQQSSRIEALQRDLQASASLEKQSMLALTSKDLHGMRGEQLKSRSHLKKRTAQLHREKADLLEQYHRKGQLVKNLVEGICRDEVQLSQELIINFRLQTDCERLKRFLNRAMKELREYEETEMESQLNLQGEMKNNCSEVFSEAGKLRTESKTSLPISQCQSREFLEDRDYTEMQHLPSPY